MMDKEDDYDKYENTIKDVDEVEGTDVKINFDFYMHTALNKLQVCLTKDNMKEGLMQYRLIVEHMEGLAEAARVLGKDYYEKVEEFKKSKEYAEMDDDLNKSTKLADKKFRLITSQVFSNKIALDSIKL